MNVTVNDIEGPVHSTRQERWHKGNMIQRTVLQLACALLLTHSYAEGYTDQLRVGSEVRVQLHPAFGDSSSWLTGRVAAVSADSLSIVGSTGEQTLAAMYIMRLQQRNHITSQRSRAIGAGIVLGGISGALAFRSLCKDKADPTQADQLLECGDFSGIASVAASALGGTVFGFAARQFTTRWQDVSLSAKSDRDQLFSVRFSLPID